MGTATFIRTKPVAPVEPPPPPPTEHSILSVYDDGSSIHAWEYDDTGAFVAELAVTARPWPSGSVYWGILYNVGGRVIEGPNGPIILFSGSVSFADIDYYAWDLTLNTVAHMVVPATRGSEGLQLSLVPVLYSGEWRSFADFQGTGTRTLVMYGWQLDGSSRTEISTWVASPMTGIPYPSLVNGRLVLSDACLAVDQYDTVPTPSPMDILPLDGSAYSKVAWTRTSDAAVLGYALACFLVSESGSSTLFGGYAAGGTGSGRLTKTIWDSVAHTLEERFVTSSAVTMIATQCASKSLSSDAGGIYPFSGSPGVMKIYAPGSAPSLPSNSNTAPTITLAANGGHVPQYAWLYQSNLSPY